MEMTLGKKLTALAIERANELGVSLDEYVSKLISRESKERYRLSPCALDRLRQAAERIQKS